LLSSQSFLRIAESAAAAHPEISIAPSPKNPLKNRSGTDVFKDDLQKVRFLKIGRYPTLTFTTDKHSRGIMITGYRLYEVRNAWTNVHFRDRKRKKPVIDGFFHTKHK
jgi:hypothetical protein